MTININLTILFLLLSSFNLLFGQHTKLNLKSIRMVLAEKNKKIHPGDELTVGIIAMDESGTEHKTKGFLHGDLKWNLFNVIVDGGTVDAGKIILSKDHASFTNFKAKITATFIENHAVSESLEIPISFDQNYIADYSGIKRSNPHHHHENGPSGYNLDITVAPENDNQTNQELVVVRIKCLEDSKLNSFYILDTQTATLKISTAGADGGKGIPGSWGGSGFGNGGHGGNGFNGGNGGAITLTIDPSLENNYKKFILLDVAAGRGGATGNGGNPGAKGGEKGKDGLPGKAGQDGKIEIRVAEKSDENPTK